MKKNIETPSAVGTKMNTVGVKFPCRGCLRDCPFIGRCGGVLWRMKAKAANENPNTKDPFLLSDDE